jgi:hypothetical protein
MGSQLSEGREGVREGRREGRREGGREIIWRVGGREGRREGWVGRTVHALSGLLERGDDTAVLALGHLEHQGSCCNKINTIKNNIKKDRGKCEKDEHNVRENKGGNASFLPSLPTLPLPHHRSSCAQSGSATSGPAPSESGRDRQQRQRRRKGWQWQQPAG